MKALILAADGVEDSELLYPFYRFQEEGIRAEIAGPRAGTITGKHGYTFESTLSFADAASSEYDVMVLPGGKAPETVRLSREALSATRDIIESGKPVAAICHGAQVLISAGVVRGRKATCYKGIRDDLKAAGAEYVDREVVVDGNLITSRFPGDLPAFCREIFRALGEQA